MSSTVLYQKLKQCFPNDIQNIDVSQISVNCLREPQSLSALISENLPHLSIEQIHSLCRRQEKNVMDKILEVKQFDIYEEIGKVCPSQKNLKQMSSEDMNLKISQYSAKLALEQKMSQETQDSEENYQSSESEDGESCEEQMVHPMEIQDLEYEPKGLHNIFEDCDNIHLPWNEMCIYDMN